MVKGLHILILFKANVRLVLLHVLQALLENTAVNSQVDLNTCYAARPSCLEDDLATEVNIDHIVTRGTIF